MASQKYDRIQAAQSQQWIPEGLKEIETKIKSQIMQTHGPGAVCGFKRYGTTSEGFGSFETPEPEGKRMVIIKS